MTFSKNKKIVLGLVAVIALGLSYQFFGRQALEDWLITRRLHNNTEWLADFQNIRGLIARDQKEPNDVGRLLTLGLAWKSLGEKTNDQFFLNKSLEVYSAGAEKFGANNLLFYWNAGKLSEELGQYSQAEKYYLKSIKLGDGYAEGYQYLTELYQYKLKLPKEKILDIYAAGIKNLFNPTPLLQSRAAYLRSVGDNAEAIKDYQTLAKAFPDYKPYQDVIKELQQNLK